MTLSKSLPNRIKRKDLPQIRKQLLALQGNACRVCNRTDISEVNWCVDHCHTTGLIRGVLCRTCNQLEGKIRKFCVSYLNAFPLGYILENMANYLAHPTNTVEVYHWQHKTEDEKRLDRNRKARLRRAKIKATGGT